MFRAVITDRGQDWLEEGEDSLTRRALVTLVSPSLLASDPRALVEAFCEREKECLGAHLSIDECRMLWRTLLGSGAITLRRGAESYHDPLGRLDEVAINH